MESDRLPHPGDVYAFPVERIGRFGAIQIIAVDESTRVATVTLLAWTGERLPDIADLSCIPRWVRSFMYWRPHDELVNVELPVPQTFSYLGKLPVTGDIECRSYGGWDFAEFVVRQFRWDAAPPALTTAFKASLDSEETVCIPGLIDPDSNDFYTVTLGSNVTRHFRDDARYRIAEDFRMESLRAWPALGYVTLNAWREDLIPFLEAAPLVGELQLSSHGQRVLDFSRTHLDRLSVDVTGLARLALPESLDMLILHGTFDGELTVDAAEAGRWMTLHVIQGVAPVRGLERVRGLRINKITRLSLSDVAPRHPQLRYLHLFGAPGLLDDLDALPELTQLESLWIVDLFGYGPESIPNLDTMPALQSLDLDSIPADVAAHVRKICKKQPRIELSVRKPRKPEWLAENLDNPLRHWDGREGIPAAVSKKTSAAYRTAVKAVREAADDTGVIAAITAFLHTIQAQNAKRYFLYTLERDEVIDAVNALSTRLSPEAQRALDPIIEEALDD